MIYFENIFKPDLKCYFDVNELHSWWKNNFFCQSSWFYWHTSLINLFKLLKIIYSFSHFRVVNFPIFRAFYSIFFSISFVISPKSGIWNTCKHIFKELNSTNWQVFLHCKRSVLNVSNQTLFRYRFSMGFSLFAI